MYYVYKAKEVEVLLGRFDPAELNGMWDMLVQLLDPYELRVCQHWETDYKREGRWYFSGHGTLGRFNPDQARYEIRRGWLVEIHKLTGESYRYNLENVLPYMNLERP